MNVATKRGGRVYWFLLQGTAFFMGLEAPEAEFLFPKLAGPPNKLCF